MFDFRNINTLWAAVVVETLARLGLNTAIICPGSRSTPLTVAFAQHPQVEAIPILDERSASFFALGIAKKTGLPVAVVCTSGTAGANFYPAIIESHYSQVPLLILTADRPAYLRHCHAGQTIDQLKLYGNYPNWQAELAQPTGNITDLAYLRQTIIHAWERVLFPHSGPVHLNFPFSEPLAPITTTENLVIPTDFWRDISPVSYPQNLFSLPPTVIEQWQSEEKGIIIAGLAQSANSRRYCQAIARLSQFLCWPVLAEALSPIRNYADLHPYLISTYDLILRNPQLGENLAPIKVIQIGELPTSKELRTWLDFTQPQRWIIAASPDNFDPLHGFSVHLRINIEDLLNLPELKRQMTNYCQWWCDTQVKVKQAIDQTMASMDNLFEGKTPWLLSQILPPKTPLFIANSMPVRHMEFFWSPNNNEVIPYFNRGANGIDGTLSTALGMAHHGQSAVMLTGDLALLHDTNGFLIREKFKGHLTIILINNNGGGIFEMLPISQFEPPFTEFFATPQNINFAHLCHTYGVEHTLISNWQQLQQLLNPLPEKGIRVLELPTDRKADALWLKDNLGNFSEGVDT